MSLETVYDYFQHYDKDTYQVVACKGNEPTLEDITNFEDSLGMKLPQEFKDFTLSSLGGLYMDTLESIWPQATLYQVGPFWSFCRGIIVFGIADNIPDFLDLRIQTKELHDAGFTNYIPFMKIEGNGDEMFCFDSTGKIYLLDYYQSGEAEEIDFTFSDCLMHEIHELEERKNRILRGEHK